MDEIWKSVVGYECHYEVSSMGRIRALRHNNARSKTPLPRVIHPEKSKSGYFRAQLYKNGHRRRIFVQRIVLAAFVGERPLGKEAAHLNGNRLDNRIENLRWVTPSENSWHKLDHGTLLRGERNGRAKITADAASKIREQRASGREYKDLAAEFGLSTSSVFSICKGVIWKHLLQ